MQSNNQDLLQDSVDHTTAVLADLQATLATVMGPAEAGSLDNRHLTDQLQELGPPPARSASSAATQSYMVKLKAAMEQAVQVQTQQAYDAATQKATEKVTANAEILRQAVDTSINLAKTQAANTTAGGVNSTSKVVEIFLDSVDTVTTIMKQIDAQYT